MRRPGQWRPRSLAGGGAPKTPTPNESRFPDAPFNIQALPVDKRGYPVPWFAEWIGGEPEFRVVDPRKIAYATQQRLCFICGRTLGRIKAFVIGPMCTINRISSEPPTHYECALFAVKACPFLSQPLARRNELNLPDRMAPPGMMAQHNPGVVAVWATLHFKVELEGAAKGLFTMGKPERVLWFTEGRPAQRREADRALAAGAARLNALIEPGDHEGYFQLGRDTAEALKHLPPR
jgi:hypothetical protein